ncbi:MAG: hypothetical protein QM778_06335 [Myxococcales bacterium]
MGKERRTARGVLALCALGVAASLGAGSILQARAPARGALSKPTPAGAPAPSVAMRSALPELPAIDLSPEARRHLTRSIELTAQGRFDQARASCRAVMSQVSPAVISACVAPIDGLTGRYEVARHSLERALDTAGSLEQQVWLYTLLGELAYWNGDLQRAEQALGSALALAPTQRRLLGLHVDLLLDTGRARQALSVLAGQDTDDGMLLRETLAYQQLGLVQAARASAQRLQRRYDEAAMRGTPAPLRDEARFYVNMPGHERRALELSRASFAQGQSPWDARLLLEAAVHLGDARAAQPALAWLRRTNLESPALHLLAAQLTFAH